MWKSKVSVVVKHINTHFSILSPKSSSPSSSSISASKSPRRAPSSSKGAKSGPGDDTFDRGVAAGELSAFD